MFPAISYINRNNTDMQQRGAVGNALMLLPDSTAGLQSVLSQLLPPYPAVELCAEYLHTHNVNSTKMSK